MKLHAFLILVLASSAAAADSIGIPLSSGLSLADGRIVTAERADVIASASKLIAPRGISRAGGQTGFEQSAPILLGEPYLVRDANGRKHRIEVKALVGNILWVVTDPVDVRPEPVRTDLAGVYRLASWTIDGLATTSVFPELELRPDGTFRLGGAQGRYARGDRTVSLDGHYAGWGPATISPGAQSVSFQFSRGALQYRIVMEKVDAASLTASAQDPAAASARRLP